MFTGLIKEKGRIRSAGPGPGGLGLTVEAPLISKEVKIGDSVSVNGVCLTVVSSSDTILSFDVVQETVSRSTLDKLRIGDSVNLEPSLCAGDPLGGHLVQGHVDGIGVVRDITRHGGETILKFNAPSDIMIYLVEKGSIAIDGISLTIADLASDWFTVAVIPHTLKSTNLGEISSGSAVNLETDIIGKYVFKFVRGGNPQTDQRLLDKLAEGGWME